MPARDHLLAVDLGTQSVRALLFDLAGELVAGARVELEPYVSPRPGWAEHDPEYYWRNLAEACQRLWASSPVPASAVAGAALTTQRGTVVACDETGRALRPAIVWLDQRRAEGLPALGGAAGLGLRAVGAGATVADAMAQAEVWWLKRHEAAVWARTRRLVFLSGFLTHRLVGRWVDSVGSQVGYLPFDYRRLRWAAPGSWRWRAFPVEPGMLPELVEPGTVLGEVTPAAAAATGIPAGLPLVAAAADKACEALGSGCLEPGVGCLSYGTTATVNATHRRYVEALPFVPPYPAAVPGHHSLEVQIYRGYWLVSWFKREFGLRELTLARERGVEPEALFDELVAAVPPGAMGLTLQPTWSPGVRFPGPEAKGAVVGFGDVHTRSHLYRAILEGLAYALREGAERCQRRAGVPFAELRVAGGGSQSDQAMQITADVFGLPASRPHVHEASGLGAAVDAAVGLGLHPGFPAAVRAMTRVARTFEPEAARRDLYDQLYHRVYRQLYRRLKPLYEEIRAITGYPAGRAAPPARGEE